MGSDMIRFAFCKVCLQNCELDCRTAGIEEEVTKCPSARRWWHRMAEVETEAWTGSEYTEGGEHPHGLLVDVYTPWSCRACRPLGQNNHEGHEG